MNKFKVFKLLFIIISLPSLIFGAEQAVNHGGVMLSKKVIRRLQSGKHHIHAIVKTKGSNQELDFIAGGTHSRSCRVAFRKLSRYEDYKLHIPFVKESSYNEKSKMARFLLSSKLLPNNMILKFKIPRIKNTGTYPFTFTEGFLKGINGEIHVGELNKKCIIFNKSYWLGPTSKIPNLIFELFTETLARIALDTLFRISSN